MRWSGTYYVSFKLSIIFLSTSPGDKSFSFSWREKICFYIFDMYSMSSAVNSSSGLLPFFSSSQSSDLLYAKTAFWIFYSICVLSDAFVDSIVSLTEGFYLSYSIFKYYRFLFKFYANQLKDKFKKIKTNL